VASSIRVGVFDSGLGGLTVVSAILKQLPNIDLIYIADSARSPYGEKSHDTIKRYSFEIANYLIKTYNIDALVLACNSATSASIKDLREHYNTLPIIGIEPGIKPAIKVTKSKKIGVLATPATLSGKKYQDLIRVSAKDSNVKLYEQPCFGLAKMIEEGKANSQETKELLKRWLEPMRDDSVDTIVLGCTHYPLVKDAIKEIMKRDINFIETGEAIAKRLESLLSKPLPKSGGLLKIYSTGKIDKEAVKNILGFEVDIKELNLRDLKGEV